MAETSKKKGGIIRGSLKTVAAVYVVAAVGGGLYQVFNDHSDNSMPTKLGQGAVTGMWLTTRLAAGYIGEAVGAGYDKIVELAND